MKSFMTKIEFSSYLQKNSGHSGVEQSPLKTNFKSLFKKSFQDKEVEKKYKKKSYGVNY